ncbi:MAG TPA: ECF transporter S component [Firmicutes bacterium]|nr:ECF transporter S component [Bacillota bacterium]
MTDRIPSAAPKADRRRPLLTVVATALLAAIAYVLMLLEFPLLPSASHLKMDFGDLPAVLGGVLFGPVCGVAVELVKNLLEMLTKGLGTQMGFGNLQNFLVGCAFVLPYTLLYRWLERKNCRPAVRLTVPALVGLVSILVVGFLSNLVVAPLYLRFFLGQVLSQELVVSYAVVSLPFNALKAAILSVVLVPLLTTAIQPIRRAIHLG